jgi:hypothetical protein
MLNSTSDPIIEDLTLVVDNSHLCIHSMLPLYFKMSDALLPQP